MYDSAWAHWFSTGFLSGFITLSLVWFLSVRNTYKITKECCMKVSKCLDSLMQTSNEDENVEYQSMDVIDVIEDMELRDYENDYAIKYALQYLREYADILQELDEK